MEIRWYAEILQRRKWLVVLTTFMAVAVAGLGSYLMTPVYSASTMVRIAQMQDDWIDYQDLNYSVRLMNTYVRLLRSGPFLGEVIQRLGLNTVPEELARRVEVEALSETELLKITAEGPDPRQAMGIANMLGTVLIEQGQKVYSGEGKTAREMLQGQLTTVEQNLAEDRALLQSLLNDSTSEHQSVRIQDLDTRIRSQEETYAMLVDEYNRAQVGEEIRANSISVVEPATAPKAPSKPRIKLNMTLGALVGLVGGLGLAFFVENLDPALHSRHQSEVLRAEVTERGNVINSFQEQLAKREAVVEELKAQLSERGRAIDSCQEQLAKREAVVEELKAQLSEKGRAIDSFQEELAEREATVGDLKARLREKEGEFEVLRAEVIERDNAIDSLQEELAEREGAVEDLKAWLREKEGEVEALRAQVIERERAIDSLQEQLAKREGAVEDLKAWLREKEGEVEALRAEVIERGRAIDSFQEELAEREGMVGELKAQLSEKEGEVEALRAEVIERGNAIGSFQEELAEREGEVGELKVRLREREGEIEALRAQVIERGRAINSFQEELAERESMIGELKAELSERERAIDSLQEELAGREGAVGDLKARLREKEGEFEALRAEVIERGSAIGSFQEQLAEREATVENLKARLREKEGEIEALRAQVTERGNAIDSFQEQLAEREAAVRDLKAQLTRSRRWVTVLDLDAGSSPGEAYQILRTSFLSLSSRIAKKMLLITSVEPGVGKSRLLANLAVGMAQAGQRVVAVDGNFRRPSLHHVFDLGNELGLSDIILDRSRVDTALQETGIQGLRVLTSGPLPPNPAELLGSAKMQGLIWELAIEADMVLLDSAPVLDAADAAVLAPIVDGVLLVAARDQATEENIQRALQEMDKVGAKALGLVLDKAKAGDRDHYPHHSYVTGGVKAALEFGPRKRR